MPLHHTPPPVAHPATAALVHAVVLQRRKRQCHGLVASGTTTKSPTSSFKSSGQGPMKSDRCESTDSCSSSSCSCSSDEDQADPKRNIEYLEHLSIRNEDPSLRGLVRSMAIRENLCDLLRCDNHYCYEIIHSATPSPVVGALPPANIQPFMVLETDTIDKTKQMEEDSGSLDSVASKNQSTQLHPLLRQHPARLS